MKTRNFSLLGCLFIVLIGMALVSGAAPQAGKPPSLRKMAITVEMLTKQMADLSKQHEDLLKRVRKLEANKASGPVAMSGGKQGRVMAFERSVQATVDREKLGKSRELMAQAERLFGQAKAIEADVAAKDKQLEKRRDRYGRIVESDKDFKKRKRRHELWKKAQKETAFKQKQDGRKIRGEAIRLEREAEGVKQIVYGWDGERSVILETTRDLSRQLSEISTGDFITWWGKKMDTNLEIERYSVTKIEQVSEPTGFTPRDS